jgi:hypothetical protein
VAVPSTEEKQMNLLNFIVKNPDLVSLVVGTAVALVWHKGKKQTESDRWDVLLQLGRQLLPKLLKDARLYDDAYVRSKLREYMVDGLTRLKVPMNPIISDLVDEAVEHVHGELAQMVMKYNLDQYIKVSEKTVELKAAQ